MVFIKFTYTSDGKKYQGMISWDKITSVYSMEYGEGRLVLVADDNFSKAVDTIDFLNPITTLADIQAFVDEIGELNG